MEPYKVHVGDWTIGIYPTDKDQQLTLTVVNNQERSDYLTRIQANVTLKRHYIGSMCAGDLYPSPFDRTVRSGKTSKSLEKMLSEQGCG